MIITWVNQPAMRGGGTPSWSPDSLGDALIDMFDFEDVASLSLSGNLINSITGKKTGLLLSQNVSGKKPIYQISSAINGRPASWYDGTDDVLISADTYTYVTGNTPLIMIALVSQEDGDGDSNTRSAFSLSSVANNTRRIRKATNGGVKRGSALVGTGAGSAGVLNNNVVFQGVYILEGEFQPTQVQVNMNGVTGGYSSKTASSAGGQVAIGSASATSQPWLGLINSVWLIDPAHANWSPENKAALLAYLKSRGGIA